RDLKTLKNGSKMGATWPEDGGRGLDLPRAAGSESLILGAFNDEKAGLFKRMGDWPGRTNCVELTSLVCNDQGRDEKRECNPAPRTIPSIRARVGLWDGNG